MGAGGVGPAPVRQGAVEDQRPPSVAAVLIATGLEGIDLRSGTVGIDEPGPGGLALVEQVLAVPA